MITTGDVVVTGTPMDVGRLIESRTRSSTRYPKGHNERRPWAGARYETSSGSRSRSASTPGATNGSSEHCPCSQSGQSSVQIS